MRWLEISFGSLYNMCMCQYLRLSHFRHIRGCLGLYLIPSLQLLQPQTDQG